MEKKLSEYGRKVGKNDSYIRCDILQLLNDFGQIALIVTCKYKHTENFQYATFVNVRVFDPADGKKTKYQLTDHINIPRKLLDHFISLTAEYNHKKFFALCIPKTYDHYGVIRGGMDLLTGAGVIPIARAPEKEWKWNNLLNSLLAAQREYNASHMSNPD